MLSSGGLNECSAAPRSNFLNLKTALGSSLRAVLAVPGAQIDRSARSLAGPAPAKDHGLVPQLLSSPGFYPSLMAPVKAIEKVRCLKG